MLLAGRFQERLCASKQVAAFSLFAELANRLLCCDQVFGPGHVRTGRLIGVVSQTFEQVKARLAPDTFMLRGSR